MKSETKKKQYPKFRDIDIKMLYNAMKEAYRNAEDYYYEAELLIQMRKYGHSLALSTLGIEELGKSSGYFFLISLKISPELLREQDNLNPDKIIEIIHTGHKKKQIFSLLFAFFTHIAFFDILQLLDEIYKKGDENFTLKYINNQIHEIQRKAQKKVKNIKRWFREIEFLEGLEEKKMIGLYVDLKSYPIVLSYPKQIKAKDSKKALSVFEKYLDLLDFIPNIIWEDDVYDTIEMKKEIMYGNT